MPGRLRAVVDPTCVLPSRGGTGSHLEYILAYLPGRLPGLSVVGLRLCELAHQRDQHFVRAAAVAGRSHLISMSTRFVNR